ncbi:MAG TPA: RNase A-like domain-containing protein [Pyrinomonadaceae bacterium]|jgi:hypothetical protein
MANRVNNNGINAEVNVGGAVKVNVSIGEKARVSENQSKGIFQNVNENYTKNPQHARAGGQNNQGKHTGKDKPKADAPPAQNDAPPVANEDRANDVPRVVTRKMSPDDVEVGGDAALLNRPARGENGQPKPSSQGILNGQGHHKQGNQGQNPPPAQTPTGPSILILPTDQPLNQQTIAAQTNPQTGTTLNVQSSVSARLNSPVVLQATAHDNGNHFGQYKNGQLSAPVTANGSANRQINPSNNHPNLGVNYSVSLNLRADGNQPFGLIRQAVTQVLQRNDVYLSHNTINRLINNQTFQTSTGTFSQTRIALPREVDNFIQTVGRQVLSLLDNSHHNQKLIHQLSKEIAHQLRDNMQTVRQQILKNTDLGALDFKQLNVREKMHVAVELLPQHLPAKAVEPLLHHKAPEVLDGLLLARGLIVPSERAVEVRNLVAAKSSVLPAEVSMTALRDVGQLVKTLIADTAAAKTTANLDLAVQKFVKILLANNELGVLLATITLAAQSQNQGGLVSRSLALAQIYELINQLVQAGEKALKETAAEKNFVQKERNIFAADAVSTVEDFDESKILPAKTHAGEAAGSLRQFLEFNPAFVYDNSTSAFNNPEDARQAQKDFIDLYHNDIAEWLESGKHRFVKEIDFDKPVGVVVERGNDSVFTANTARFVLVRDSSVQGWHFLKSFLVK